MLLLLLIYVVLRALWKIDVYLISTLVNKSRRKERILKETQMLLNVGLNVSISKIIKQLAPCIN